MKYRMDQLLSIVERMREIDDDTFADVDEPAAISAWRLEGPGENEHLGFISLDDEGNPLFQPAPAPTLFPGLTISSHV